jgi:hypothetical protein
VSCCCCLTYQALLLLLLPLLLLLLLPLVRHTSLPSCCLLMHRHLQR